MEKTDTAERVLIVEDETATRVGLTELVSAWGFLTDEAADGEAALQKVTTFRPAIIVSDLVSSGWRAFAGVGMAALGFPVYWLWKGRRAGGANA